MNPFYAKKTPRYTWEFKKGEADEYVVGVALRRYPVVVPTSVTN
ncbi:MAG: hypothetical protein N4A52_12070 [Halodesulfovibrio sp.]|nr:hypothetical protein [Halodesulfovibrio sp.]